MTDSDLERIESKLDEILFRLGKGRPRTSAEIKRLADSKFLSLQIVNGGSKKRHEREKHIEQ